MSSKLKSITEKLREESLKYDLRSKFRKARPGIHKVASRLGIWDEICSHMPIKFVHNKKSLEELQLEANKYTKRGDFAKGSPRAYESAWKRPEFDHICAHMDTPLNEPYTRDELHEIALKYTTRGMFCLEHSSAYTVARMRGILDSVCSHMPPPSNFKYSIEELGIIAKKYVRRIDFVRGESGAYSAARHSGVLDLICTHMKPSKGTSYAERELLCEIKKIFPNAKKMRDMKVNIADKPYIHGFEIDILIGNLGIEFDGKYHHSFEYMRADKGKRFWSDEDIRNYNKLKDDWFETKGIKILHIKEDEWKAEKRVCVDKCLSFLGILKKTSENLILAP